MENLPDNVILRIFDKIDNPQAAVRLGSTCKRLSMLERTARYALATFTDNERVPVQWLVRNKGRVGRVLVSCTQLSLQDVKALRKSLSGLTLELMNLHIDKQIFDDIHKWLRDNAANVVTLLRSASHTTQAEFNARRNTWESLIGIDFDRDHYARATFAWSYDPLTPIGLFPMDLSFHFWCEDDGRCSLHIDVEKRWREDRELVYRTVRVYITTSTNVEQKARELFEDLQRNIETLWQFVEYGDEDDVSDGDNGDDNGGMEW